MIAKCARIAVAIAAMLALAGVAAAGDPTQAFSTPLAVPQPVATPGSTFDSGWAPAPGTAAYDPAMAPTPTTPQSVLDGAAKAVRKLELTPGQRLYELTRDASFLDPVSWNLTAYKSRHQLIVYYKGRIYKTYRAVFGRSREIGTKEFEGDRRTPEGVYTIIEKHQSRRWRWFLGLNYPNKVDRNQFEQLRDAREIPIGDDGRELGEGGHIGIHGTDTPILNDGGIDWTIGCISVSNRDIDELSRIIPTGTVVIIKP